MLDPEVLPNLRELGKNCGIFLDSKMDAIEPSRSAESDHGSLNNESLNNESPNIESSQRTVHVPKAEATELTVDIPKENWVYVSPSTIHQVVICEFISPDSFFVQIVNKSDKWFKFIQKLDDHEPKKIPLENGKPGVICLAITEDGLVRVKLLEELNGKFKICNLDNGYLTENVSKEFLYEIPLELLTYIPFQVSKSKNYQNFQICIKICYFQGIHCKLTGIRPHNSKSWSLEASEEILNRIIAINPIYMKTACQQKTSKDLHELVTCASYKVILLDHSAEPPIKLNQTLIQESLADEDPSTSTHLDVNIEFEECWDDELDSYESSEESGKFSLKDENENEPGLKFEDFDIMFEDKEFFETIGLPSTAKFVLPDKNPLSVTKPKENLVAAYKAVQPKKACVKEPLDSDDDSDDDTSPPVLVTATKHPRIEWQQTESLIRLKIQAIDCLDYSFEVNYETISIL